MDNGLKFGFETERGRLQDKISQLEAKLKAEELQEPVSVTAPVTAPVTTVVAVTIMLVTTAVTTTPVTVPATTPVTTPMRERPGLSQALMQTQALHPPSGLPPSPGRDEPARTTVPAGGEPDVAGEVVVLPGGRSTSEKSTRSASEEIETDSQSKLVKSVTKLIEAQVQAMALLHCRVFLCCIAILVKEARLMKMEWISGWNIFVKGHSWLVGQMRSNSTS